MPPVIANYPALASLKTWPVTSSWIWSAPNAAPHLERMEKALANLSRKGFDETALNETLSFLLDPNSDARWLAGNVELIGLAHLASQGQLVRAGWTGSTGGSAPFDAEIRSPWVPFSAVLRRWFHDPHRPPKSLVLDFKPAAESGLILVHAALQPVADRWATAAGLGDVQLELGFAGALTKEVVGNDEAQLATDFDVGLQAKTTLPQTVRLTLSGGARIDVTVSERDILKSDKGTTMVDDKAKGVYGLLHRHVKKKAKHYALGCPPFILMYVAPYGHPGADIDEHTLSRATRSLDQDLDASGAQEGARWLGTGLLDQTGAGACFVYLRPSVARRHIVSARCLARRVQAVQWPAVLSSSRPLSFRKKGR